MRVVRRLVGGAAVVAASLALVAAPASSSSTACEDVGTVDDQLDTSLDAGDVRIWEPDAFAVDDPSELTVCVAASSGAFELDVVVRDEDHGAWRSLAAEHASDPSKYIGLRVLGGERYAVRLTATADVTLSGIVRAVDRPFTPASGIAECPVGWSGTPHTATTVLDGPGDTLVVPIGRRDLGSSALSCTGGDRSVDASHRLEVRLDGRWLTVAEDHALGPSGTVAVWFERSPVPLPAGLHPLRWVVEANEGAGEVTLEFAVSPTTSVAWPTRDEPWPHELVFGSTTDGVGFECSTDLVDWRACSSPYRVPGSLVLGDNRFVTFVRAVEPGTGVADPTPAELVIEREVPVAEQRFTDVEVVDTFRREISLLAFTEITRGCNPPANDRFCPAAAVTRAQMASFLVRALGLSGSDDRPFRDDDGSVHERDVAALAAAGITRGCNPPADDRFCPDRPVTREEMATFLGRALGLPAAPSQGFVDTAGSVHAAAVDALAASGVTRGCNPPANDRFCPRDEVTREQLAAFLVRAGLAG